MSEVQKLFLSSGMITLLLTFIVIPAVRFWLGREYTTSKAFKDYKDDCEKAATTANAEMDSRLEYILEKIEDRNKQEEQWRVELVNRMTRWVDKQEKNNDRLMELETKMSVFWNMVEKTAVGLLHKDDDKLGLDHLLDKLPPDRMTRDERRALVEKLGIVEHSQESTTEEQFSAGVLRAAVVARYHKEFQEELG